MTRPTESFLNRYGLALPAEPDTVHSTGRGALLIYSYENTEVVVPAAHEKHAHEIDVNKAILEAVNLALDVKDYQNEPVIPVETPHGTDEIERFNGFSLVKIADREILEAQLIRASANRKKNIVGIFGTSSVLLSRWSDSLIEDVTTALRTDDETHCISVLKHN